LTDTTGEMERMLVVFSLVDIVLEEHKRTQSERKYEHKDVHCKYSNIQ
jgi:hypothetical protein